MRDLIEMLRSEADISARPGQMDRLNALADEFAAALEAARELANKWRKSEGGPYAYVAMQCAEQLDAAIDQARGKGVADA